MKSRRSFLVQSAAVSSGFFGLSRFLNHEALGGESFSFGELIPDPHRLLDLPKGFSYRVLSYTGDRMNDGYTVPGKPDGMACFDLGGGKVALVRNHEIGHSGYQEGPFKDNKKLPKDFDEKLIYDGGRHGAQPFVGGTTTLVYDLKKEKIVNQYLSLVGTDRNCAGGPTPWGSWVTCEEPADMTSQWGKVHGYCFEVPASENGGLVEPVALKEMGRFRHEAIAVDPESGIVYLTEDRSDGVIYRFIPKVPGELAKGGKLQALAIKGEKDADTRNWPESKYSFPVRKRVPVLWVDLEDVESPNDDLRMQAMDKGAVIFSRGEGMWYGSPDTVGESSIYWACTDGGPNTAGQIFRYFPGEDVASGELELYLEPNDTDILRNGDNITISPTGHLFICEDTGVSFIRGVTKEGEIYTFARNALNGKEFAGACFSPDGKTMFVNLQTPGFTVAITGPFA